MPLSRAFLYIQKTTSNRLACTPILWFRSTRGLEASCSLNFFSQLQNWRLRQFAWNFKPKLFVRPTTAFQLKVYGATFQEILSDHSFRIFKLLNGFWHFVTEDSSKILWRRLSVIMSDKEKPYENSYVSILVLALGFHKLPSDYVF